MYTSRYLTKWAAYGKIVLSHESKIPMFKGFVGKKWKKPRVTDQVRCYYYSTSYEFR